MSAKPLVILPTYNEKDNIEPLIREIFAIAREVSILVVDDDSPDKTAQAADSLKNTYPNLNVIYRLGPRGRGLAGAEGFQWALAHNFDPIIEMDADFSHSPKDVPRFLDEIKNYDLVIGSRYISGGEDKDRFLFRRFLSDWANRYVRWLFGLKVMDCTSGYRCFRKDALRTILSKPLISKGPSLVEEVLTRSAKAGQGIHEIPIVFQERRSGKSKLNLFGAFKVLLSLWKIYFKCQA